MSTFVIPSYFVQHTVDLCGDKGHAWIERLPAILAACEQRWHIHIDAPFPGLSYHYVAPAIAADGMAVVVKAQIPTSEFAQEVEALRVFDGHGVAQLLADDLEDEVMLLEHVQPGTMLSNLEDDTEATLLFADVMQRMRRPVPAVQSFPSVQEWGKGFARLRRHYNGGTGPFPRALLEEAETLYAELSASMGELLLLHGDLHHENILYSQQRGWLAIDPKGLIGEAAYEVGTMLHNPLPKLLNYPDPQRMLARRVDLLSEVLGIERARVRGWGLAQSMLSVWWDVEDFGDSTDVSGHSVLACAQWLAEIK